MHTMLGMKYRSLNRTIALLSALLLAPAMAHAQALPTAERAISLSAFGMGTGTYTGIEGGKILISQRAMMSVCVLLVRFGQW